MDTKTEGMVNFRGFGGYSTNLGSEIVTRHGFLYRSGHLSSLTPTGWEMIHQLSISTIFRLTTPEEASSLYAKQGQLPEGAGGIVIIDIPFDNTEFSRKNVLEKYIEHASRGPIAAAEGYLDILRQGSSVIAKILLRISANPESVCLIHCSMGKDRTGVVFALLLSLAGVPNQIIADEYELSEEGLEPHLPTISKLVQQTVPSDAGSIDADAMARQVISSSAEVMLLTLQMIDEEFGGVSQYLRHQCGLSSNDLKHIQHILTQRKI